MVVFSDEIVDKVVAMMEMEFEENMIVDLDVKREFVQMVLNDDEITQMVQDKYELQNLINSAEDVDIHSYDEQKRVIVLDMYLNSDEQNMLQRNNRDVRLRFAPGGFRTHALAYAQRIIDTDRCLRQLSNSAGPIIDIGGNYRAHKRQCRVIHSCTLLASVREAHRHQERDVQLESEYPDDDRLNRCIDGAQNCYVQATQSMSVHTMPDIPWEDWPDIMDKHGLQYHIGVFHYDPSILIHNEGKLEGSNMFFSKQGKDIVFHFENDGSLDYTHNFDNYIKYVAPWCQYSKSTPYAYISDVKNIVGGVVTVEIVRVLKDSIGRQVKKPSFAYVPNEKIIELDTFVYDANSGLDPTNSAAFKPVKLYCDKDMYQFMYMYGVSNDTANPNQPLTFAEFRSMATTYNHVRKFGEAVVSGMQKYESLTIDVLIAAIYHVIVREKAMLHVRSQLATAAMMDEQRTYQIAVTDMLITVPMAVVAAPLYLAGGLFEYYIKRFKEAWKTSLISRLNVTEAKQKESYIQIPSTNYSDIEGYNDGADVIFCREGVKFGSEKMDHIDQEEYYRKNLLESIASPDNDSTFVDTAAPSSLEFGRAKSHTRTNTLEFEREVNEDHDSDVMDDGIQDEIGHADVSFETYNSHYRNVHSQDLQTYDKYVNQYEQSNTEMSCTMDIGELHEHWRRKVLEFAMYSFDVGHGVVSTLKSTLRNVAPGGFIQKNRIDNENLAQDSGIKFFPVVDRKMSVTACNYAIGVDVDRGSVYPIIRSRDGTFAYIDSPHTSSLMVMGITRIFNSYAIGEAALNVYHSNWEPDTTMTLVNGVPGCGKTSEIVNSFTMKDVIVCAVRHSKDDTLTRVINKFGDDCDLNQLRQRVRTLDSVCMHGFKKISGVDTLFVDEGLMVYPGQLYVVIHAAKPKKVVLFGDAMQIAAIDRSPTMGLLMYPKIKKWTSIEIRNESKTMPADVCVILSKKFYKFPIYTRNPTRRSLTVRHITDTNDLRFTEGEPEWDYMSVLTADRAKLLCGVNFCDGKLAQQHQADAGLSVDTTTKNLARVFSVHEAQGQRFDQSRVVRMNPNTAAVLASQSHMTVAISRHFYKCEYNTLVDNDSLVKLMMTPVTEEELDEISRPPEEWLVRKIETIKKM